MTTPTAERERNFANRTLFHGDNLNFLLGLNSETVDLIATDPPFNKGKDFHATPESLAAGAKFQDRWSWADDVQQEWVDAIKDDEPDVSALIECVKARREDLAAFLCFMAVRLIEMRRILKPTGSIYLHCDPTASHYLKALMDAIFGDKNFRNEIVWHYVFGTSPKRDFRRKHDIILRYSKSDKYLGVQVKVPSRMAGRYDKVDEDGRRYHENGAGKRFYEGAGRMPDDVWSYIENSQFAQLNSMSSERVGYPTQKPLALYERIIKASSNPGDVVLDPFCGCATTPIAAERLGRQWVGMDLWDGAYDIVVRRLEDSRQLLADPDPRIILRGADDPPVRTDIACEEAARAPTFDAPTARAKEAWERLSHAQMRDILYEAQEGVCGGCGRELEKEFMELDHIQPRADGGANDITNRVMLCAPCNRRKSNRLTLSGLVAQTRKDKWTRDAAKARRAVELARLRANRIKAGGKI